MTRYHTSDLEVYVTQRHEYINVQHLCQTYTGKAVGVKGRNVLVNLGIC